MKTADIDRALDRALLSAASPMTKCDLADASIAFLGVLRDASGFPFNWVIGRIIDKAEGWKRERRCP